ncbi:MAG TPA: hypothetical protein VKH42_13100 [Vicinamibacterales bacterium]|nr:hypothetical protein [Vicinamibacterales bacterium]
MRRLIASGLCAVACATVGAQESLDFKDANAREILKRGRIAIGGVDAVGHVQAIVLQGLSRIPANTGPVECELEIRILLPDRYLRIDRAPFGEKRSGFEGRQSLSVISERGRTTLPPEHLVDQIVQSERERMLQLLLGAAAYLSPRDVVTFRSVTGDVGSVQPQGTADAGQRAAVRRNQEAAGASTLSPPASDSGARTYVSTTPNPYSFDVSVRPGAAFRYIADPATFLPSRITYINANGDEVTTTFAERRATEGLNLAYRITTMSRGKIIDDLLLDHIAVNPKLTKDDFR